MSESLEVVDVCCRGLSNDSVSTDDVVQHISNLSKSVRSSSGSHTEESLRRISELGAIPALVKTAREGGEGITDDLKLEIAWLISKFTEVPELCSSIIEAQALPMLSSQYINSTDVRIRGQVCWALANLSGNDTTTRDLVLSQEGLSMALAATLSSTSFGTSEIEAEVDDSGLDPQEIELVINQTYCSRVRAINALMNNESDVVNAIMEIMEEDESGIPIPVPPTPIAASSASDSAAPKESSKIMLQLELVRLSAWVISNLCRSSPPPPLSEVKVFIPALSSLFAAYASSPTAPHAMSDPGEATKESTLLQSIVEAVWAASFITHAAQVNYGSSSIEESSDSIDSEEADEPCDECVDEVTMSGMAENLLGVLSTIDCWSSPFDDILIAGLRTIKSLFVAGNENQIMELVESGALLGVLSYFMSKCVEDEGFESIRREVMKELNKWTCLLCDQSSTLCQKVIEFDGLAAVLVRAINYYKENFILSDELVNGEEDEEEEEEDDEDDVVNGGSYLDVIYALTISTVVCEEEHLSVLAAAGLEKVLVDFIVDHGGSSEQYQITRVLHEVMRTLRAMISHNHGGTNTALQLSRSAGIVDVVRDLSEDDILGDEVRYLITAITSAPAAGAAGQVEDQTSATDGITASETSPTEATSGADPSTSEAAQPNSATSTFMVSVPNAADLPSDIFLEMTEELVTNALRSPAAGRMDYGDGCTWAERGWTSKAEFVAEFREGIQTAGVGVVARGLSREEADGLIAKLTANGLPATLHGDGAEPLPELHTISPDDPLPPRPSATRQEDSRESHLLSSAFGFSAPSASRTTLSSGFRDAPDREQAALEMLFSRRSEEPEEAMTGGMFRSGGLGETLASRMQGRGLDRPHTSLSRTGIVFGRQRELEEGGRGGKGGRGPYIPSRITSSSSFSSSYAAGSSESKQDNEGEAYSLENGEVGFDTVHGRTCRFRFSKHDRVALSPMGPVMLLSSPYSESALSASMDTKVSHTMRWRVQVSGNSSWGLGVVSASPPPHVKKSEGGAPKYTPRSSWSSYPDYLASQGRCGITTTNNSLQLINGLEGKTIDVVVDLKRRVVTFSVHAQSPFTYAQPIYEPLPLRLAALGYNATVFTLLPFPEDEIAHVAIEQAIQDLANGKQVIPSASADVGVPYESYDSGSADAELQLMAAMGEEVPSSLFASSMARSGSSSRRRGAALVGKRVRVKWAGHRHFPGTVEAFSEETGMHTVRYDDGDVRQYRMHEKKWFFIPLNESGYPEHPDENTAKVGERYTFHNITGFPYPSRFQDGTIVRLLAVNPPLEDDEKNEDEERVHVPLRVQWDVTGLEGDVDYDDLEMITPFKKRAISVAESASLTTDNDSSMKDDETMPKEQFVSVLNCAVGLKVARSSLWGSGGYKSIYGEQDGRMIGEVIGWMNAQGEVFGDWHDSSKRDVRKARVRWSPYVAPETKEQMDEKLAAFIDSYPIGNKNRFYLRVARGDENDNQHSLMDMSTSTKVTLDKPESKSSSNPIWEVRLGIASESWNMFAPPIAAELERKFQLFKAQAGLGGGDVPNPRDFTVTFDIPSGTYTANVINMLQRNLATGHRRDIRRRTSSTSLGATSSGKSVPFPTFTGGSIKLPLEEDGELKGTDDALLGTLPAMDRETKPDVSPLSDLTLATPKLDFIGKDILDEDLSIESSVKLIERMICSCLEDPSRLASLLLLKLPSGEVNTGSIISRLRLGYDPLKLLYAGGGPKPCHLLLKFALVVLIQGPQAAATRSQFKVGKRKEITSLAVNDKDKELAALNEKKKWIVDFLFDALDNVAKVPPSLIAPPDSVSSKTPPLSSPCSPRSLRGAVRDREGEAIKFLEFVLSDLKACEISLDSKEVVKSCLSVGNKVVMSLSSFTSSSSSSSSSLSSTSPASSVPVVDNVTGPSGRSQRSSRRKKKNDPSPTKPAVAAQDQAVDDSPTAVVNRALAKAVAGVGFRLGTVLSLSKQVEGVNQLRVGWEEVEGFDAHVSVHAQAELIPFIPSELLKDVEVALPVPASTSSSSGATGEGSENKETSSELASFPRTRRRSQRLSPSLADSDDEAWSKNSDGPAHKKANKKRRGGEVPPKTPEQVLEEVMKKQGHGAEAVHQMQPLQYAIYKKCGAKVVDLMLKAGCDPDATGLRGSARSLAQLEENNWALSLLPLPRSTPSLTRAPSVKSEAMDTDLPPTFDDLIPSESRLTLARQYLPLMLTSISKVALELLEHARLLDMAHVKSTRGVLVLKLDRDETAQAFKEYVELLGFILNIGSTVLTGKHNELKESTFVPLAHLIAACFGHSAHSIGVNEATGVHLGDLTKVALDMLFICGLKFPQTWDLLENKFGFVQLSKKYAPANYQPEVKRSSSAKAKSMQGEDSIDLPQLKLLVDTANTEGKGGYSPSVVKIAKQVLDTYYDWLRKQAKKPSTKKSTSSSSVSSDTIAVPTPLELRDALSATFDISSDKTNQLPVKESNASYAVKLLTKSLSSPYGLTAHELANTKGLAMAIARFLSDRRAVNTFVAPKGLAYKKIVDIDPSMSSEQIAQRTSDLLVKSAADASMLGCHCATKLIELCHSVISVYSPSPTVYTRERSLKELNSPVDLTFVYKPDSKASLVKREANRHTVRVTPVAPVSVLVKHLLSAAPIQDKRYLKWCRRLVGCLIEVKYTSVGNTSSTTSSSSGNAPPNVWSRARVLSFDSRSCAHAVRWIDSDEPSFDDNADAKPTEMNLRLSLLDHRIIEAAPPSTQPTLSSVSEQPNESSDSKMEDENNSPSPTESDEVEPTSEATAVDGASNEPVTQDYCVYMVYPEAQTLEEFKFTLRSLMEELKVVLLAGASNATCLFREDSPSVIKSMISGYEEDKQSFLWTVLGWKNGTHFQERAVASLENNPKLFETGVLLAYKLTRAEAKCVQDSIEESTQSRILARVLRETVPSDYLCRVVEPEALTVSTVTSSSASDSPSLYQPYDRVFVRCRKNNTLVDFFTRLHKKTRRSDMSDEDDGEVDFWMKAIVVQSPSVEIVQHCRVRRKSTDNEDNSDALGTVESITGDSLAVLWDKPSGGRASRSGRAKATAETVSLDQVEVVMSKGTRVCRGSGWHYEDQDGGEGCFGTCEGFSRKGVAQIKWDLGRPRHNSYRCIDSTAGEIIPASKEELDRFIAVRTEMDGTSCIYLPISGANGHYCCVVQAELPSGAVDIKQVVNSMKKIKRNSTLKLSNLKVGERVVKKTASSSSSNPHASPSRGSSNDEHHNVGVVVAVPPSTENEKDVSESSGYSVVWSDAKVETNIARESLRGEFESKGEDPLEALAGMGGSGGPAMMALQQLLGDGSIDASSPGLRELVQQRLHAGLIFPGADGSISIRIGNQARSPSGGFPLVRTFSGLSLAMRSDGSDFLTGVGDTFEVNDASGLLTQRETGEGLALRRVRSMGRPLDDRPPRLVVLMRLVEPNPTSPPVAYELTNEQDSGAPLHSHPLARVGSDFPNIWPKTRQRGLLQGWKCDGHSVNSQGLRVECSASGSSSGGSSLEGRYRCTMGEDFDLCHKCFIARKGRAVCWVGGSVEWKDHPSQVSSEDTKEDSGAKKEENDHGMVIGGDSDDSDSQDEEVESSHVRDNMVELEGDISLVQGLQQLLNKTLSDASNRATKKAASENMPYDAPLNMCLPLRSSYTVEFTIVSRPPVDEARQDASEIQKSKVRSAGSQWGMDPSSGSGVSAKAALPSGYSFPSHNFSGVGNEEKNKVSIEALMPPSAPPILAQASSTSSSSAWTSHPSGWSEEDGCLLPGLEQCMNPAAAEVLLLLRCLKRTLEAPVKKSLQCFATFTSKVKVPTPVSVSSDSSSAESDRPPKLSPPAWLLKFDATGRQDIVKKLTRELEKRHTGKLTHKIVKRALSGSSFKLRHHLSDKECEETDAWLKQEEKDPSGVGNYGDLVLTSRCDGFSNNSDRDAHALMLAISTQLEVRSVALMSKWKHFVWINKVLESRLQQQLKDSTSIATQALPQWCSFLTATTPFLFSPSLRKRLLSCTAFGVSRALDFLQQDSPASATRSLEQNLTTLNERVVSMYMTGQDPQRLQLQADSIEDRIRNRRRHHTGVLKHDYVRGVRRHMVLEDAKYIARVLAGSRAALQVSFAAESGHGDGVTRGFYVAVAEAMQQRRLNAGMTRLSPGSLQLLKGENMATAQIGEKDSSSSDVMRSLRAGDTLFIVTGTPVAEDSEVDQAEVGTNDEEQKLDSVEEVQESLVSMMAANTLTLRFDITNVKQVHSSEGKVTSIQVTLSRPYDGPLLGDKSSDTPMVDMWVARIKPPGVELSVLAGPRLEVQEGSEVLDNRLVRVGDVITLQIKTDESEDEEASGGITVEGLQNRGLGPHDQVSISSHQDTPSLAIQLRQVEEQLRNNQNRSEVVSLMRKRAELQRKYQTEQVMIASTCGATNPLVVPMPPIAAQVENKSVDERFHSYRIIHIGQGVVTLDRPVHGSPGDVMIVGWPTRASSLFVPDGGATEALRGGFLGNVNGLFPAPLHPHESGYRVLENFFFLGLIAAKALQDGFLLPLPIHQVFFEVALSPNHPDPATILGGSHSYMTGCTGEMVAQMMSLLPQLRSAHRKDRSSSTGSNSSLSSPILASHRKKSDSDEPSPSTSNEAPKTLNDIFDATYHFTSGMTLRQMLTTHSMEFIDPITGLAIPPLPNREGPAAGGLVTPHNLLSYLEAVADFWLKSGVSRQIEAFKQGVSQVFDWRHLRGFTARELSDMVCGAGDVEWNEKSLQKMLQPSSGFDSDSPTIKWLISELVSFTQPQRRSFLKFSTALPRLVPGMKLTIACKGVGGSWLPTAQTCTPQLNLAVYASRKDLSAALKEAMANADADGGFHERSAGSDGNSNDVSRRRSEREERAMQVMLPSSMRSESPSTAPPSGDVAPSGAASHDMQNDDDEDEDLSYLIDEEDDEDEDDDDDENDDGDDDDEDDCPVLVSNPLEDSDSEMEGFMFTGENEDDFDDDDEDDDGEDDEDEDDAYSNWMTR